MCLCVSIPLALWREATGWWRIVFSPPSSVLRLNPSVLYTERRRQSSVPLSSHLSVRSDHAALAVVSEEECNRLGSVFVGLLCVSRRDVLSVAYVVSVCNLLLFVPDGS